MHFLYSCCSPVCKVDTKRLIYLIYLSSGDQYYVHIALTYLYDDEMRFRYTMGSLDVMSLRSFISPSSPAISFSRSATAISFWKHKWQNNSYTNRKCKSNKPCTWSNFFPLFPVTISLTGLVFLKTQKIQRISLTRFKDFFQDFLCYKTREYTTYTDTTYHIKWKMALLFISIIIIIPMIIDFKIEKLVQ